MELHDGHRCSDSFMYYTAVVYSEFDSLNKTFVPAKDDVATLHVPL